MDLEAGAELPELRVTPDKYLTVRYAGASGDFDPIHLDDDFATAVGLPGRILHGLFSMALVARAVTEAGGGPAALKRLSVEFRGMAFPEEEITVTGRVVAVEEGVARIRAEAVQAGRAVIAGAEADLAV